MKTQIATSNLPLTVIRGTAKYGITESKKAELDALTLKVINAQHTVDQFQSIVNSLTIKTTNFQGFLATADAKRTQAYNTKKLVDQMVQGAIDLLNNSQIAATEIAQARIKTDALDKKLKSVIDKLIYTAEMINKLSNVIIRKKALNPLISDELVSMIGNAGKDANNAVALTLIALKSAFTANALNIESEAAMILGYTEAIDFYQFLTGKSGVPLDGDVTPFKTPNSLESQIHKAYSSAKATYTRMEKALVLTTNQLNDAQTSLNKAQVKLKSLQAGLAAANAAALAS
jgi:flagellar hook-basal body complex protein FliE